MSLCILPYEYKFGFPYDLMRLELEKSLGEIITWDANWNFCNEKSLIVAVTVSRLQNIRAASIFYAIYYCLHNLIGHVKCLTCLENDWCKMVNKLYVPCRFVSFTICSWSIRVLCYVRFEYPLRSVFDLRRIISFFWSWCIRFVTQCVVAACFQRKKIPLVLHLILMSNLLSTVRCIIKNYIFII